MFGREGDERAHTSHIPAATAEALPPELPPATRCWSFPAADLKGFITGPWTECVLNDLLW